MNSWISVKDKLPDNRQDIICLAYSDNNKFRWVFEAIYGFHFDEKWAARMFMEGNAYLVLENGDIYLNQVRHQGIITHWMPLPELPIEIKS